MKNDETTTRSGEQRKTRRYNVSQVGHSLDSAMASEMQPLDAMVHDLRDKFLVSIQSPPRGLDETQKERPPLPLTGRGPLPSVAPDASPRSDAV